MKTMKNRDQVSFGQGWSKFVEDNRLIDGDILTFVFDGDRVFEVSIFGPGGCKEKRAIAEVIEVEDDSVCSLSDDEDDLNVSAEQEIVNTVQRSESKGKSKVTVVDDDSDEEDSDSSYSPEVEDMTRKSKTVMNMEASSSRKRMRKREPRIKNPEAHLKDPKNLYFETWLKNRTYELLVPGLLVKDHLLKFEDYIDYIDGHEDGILQGTKMK